MQNFKSIINAHNRKIIYKTNDINQQEKCNCINKADCSINSECQATNIVYNNNINNIKLENCRENVYIGISEGKLK